jgi:hypothetical protein
LPPAKVLNPDALLEIEDSDGVSKQAAASLLGTVNDFTVYDTLMIGTRARLVALPNGVKLEVFDGTNWIQQVSYTQ